MPSWMKWLVSFAVGLGIIAVSWKWQKLDWVLTTFYVLICFLLVVVVLLQSGKAADLAGAFGGAGSQTAFGPRGAATFLSKATTWCAIMFMLTSIALGLRPQAGGAGGSVLEKYSKPAPTKQPAPPSPAPQSQAPPEQQPPAPQPQAPSPQPPAKQ